MNKSQLQKLIKEVIKEEALKNNTVELDRILGELPHGTELKKILKSYSIPIQIQIKIAEVCALIADKEYRAGYDHGYETHYVDTRYDGDYDARRNNGGL